MAIDEHPGTDSSAAPAECRRARAALGAFVAGGLGEAQLRSLRQHTLGCPECAIEFRQDVELAARIARERRLERERRERELRRSERLRQARGALFGPRSMLLRTVFVPGLLIFMLSRAFPLGGGARVYALEGSYSLGVRTLDAEDRPQVVRRGEWIVTPADASAKLERKDRGAVRIAGSSMICAEDRELERLLLHAGSIEIDGPTLVTTPFGTVEVLEGSALLALERDALLVEVRSGRARVLNAFGQRLLAAGGTASLTSTGL